MSRLRSAAAWTAVGTGAASALYPRAFELALQYNLRRLRAGDPEPLLRFDADDVHFTFPGRSSFSTELRSKEQLRTWLQRFVRIGVQLYADEVIVKGPLWNTTICLRISDHFDAPDGTRVYENRAVIWGRVSWGLLREYEVYEDTERALALDAWLAANRPEVAGPA